MPKARHGAVLALPEMAQQPRAQLVRRAALSTFARKQPLGMLGGISVVLVLLALFASVIPPI